jgi:hypothetical protein
VRRRGTGQEQRDETRERQHEARRLERPEPFAAQQARLCLITTITDTPARGFRLRPEACGGRVRRAGFSVIEKILSHLGLPTAAPLPMPAKVAGWPGVVPAADWITE